MKNLRIMKFFERTSNKLRTKFERNSKNLNQLRIHRNFFEVHNSGFRIFEVPQLRISKISKFYNFENFDFRKFEDVQLQKFRKFEDVQLRKKSMLIFLRCINLNKKFKIKFIKLLFNHKTLS